jgi:predicted O-methyltransferase YrrM
MMAARSTRRRWSPSRDLNGLGPVARLRAAILERLVAFNDRRADAVLQRIPAVSAAVRRYRATSGVTGASHSDYLTLYREIRRYQPREVLELGTGISTVVLAHALLDNAAEGAPLGHLTSMEEDAGWHAQAVASLPVELEHVVDIVHSPKVDGHYKMFRGVQYASVPERPYDYIFSDGPERHSPVDGDKLFDLDFIQVVRRSDRPIRGVVDDHYLTFYVLQKVFGPELARYSPTRRLMHVGPVTRTDVRHLRRENFVADLRLLGRTELHLRMSRD